MPVRPDRTRFIPLLLVLATLAAFGMATRCDFTQWDDPSTLALNPSFNPPGVRKMLHYWRHPHMGLYIPVTYTAWTALAATAQGELPNGTGSHLKASVFHTANVLLHCLSVLVVYAILKLLFRMEWPACGGAMLFALHPVQVEPVAWVSGLKDLLCGLLSLVAIWQYLLYAIHAPVKVLPSGNRWDTAHPAPWRQPLRERKYMHFGVATIAFVAAMLAKPTAIVTPIICFAIDFWMLRRQLRRILKPLLIWAILTLPVIAISAKTQTADDVVTYIKPFLRPLVAGDALTFYLGKLIAPMAMAVDYGRRPEVVLGSAWSRVAWMLPVSLAIWIILRRRKRPWLVAASVAFVAPLLPVLGLRPFLMQYTSTVADHYLYLAMLGPAIVLTSVLTRHRNPDVAIACVLLFGAFLLRSAVQVTYWKDDETLVRHTLAVNPYSFTARINLGHDLERRGDFQGARNQFAEAVRLNPFLAIAQRNLAIEEISLKHWDEMEAHGMALMAIERERPQHAQLVFASDFALIGRQFIYQNAPSRAEPFLEEALRINPTQADAIADLAAVKKMLATRP